MKNTRCTDFYVPKNSSIKPLFKTMRVTTFLLFFCVFGAMAGTVNSQNARVSIKKTNVPLEEILNEIERQTDYLFMYSNAVDVKRHTSIHVSEKPVSEVLNQLLGNQVLYEMEGTHIILSDKHSPRNTIIVQQEDKIPVKGKITDMADEPIIGASILEKGTTNGIITDLNGGFSLDVSPGAILVISYIGYAKQEVKVIPGKTLKIKMKEDAELLDEVVVVGYGTQKKVNLTGAVETIESDVIENRPIRSATDALQGTVSGLTVSSGTGKPGEFASFKIRGNTSINSAGALVIIDGMPGDINVVNPQDIETISILKDAASAAIYGARAAEGVVLVTTKKGASEKVKVEYTGNFSFNSPTRLPESNTGLDHALLSNVAFANAGLAAPFSQKAIDAIKDPNTIAIPNGKEWIYTSDVDWIGLMMDHSFQQTHNLTISKASDRLKYLFSIGWLDQNGMFSEYGPDNYDRINLRSNISVELIKNKLSFDSRISYSRGVNLYHAAEGSWSIPYITFIQAGPNMPIYDPNGNYSRHRMQLNPIQALKEGGEGRTRNQRIEGVFTLEYKPVKGLSLRAVGGANILDGQKKEWRRAYGKYGVEGLISTAFGQKSPNSVTQNNSHRQYLTGQLIAEYKGVFGKHDINVLGGWSAEENLYEDLQGKRTDIIGNELPALNLGDTDGWSNGADENEWALVSGFMRMNYAFASKYLVEANFRADASSRFSKKHRWGVFPSASVGWRITEEKFMKNQRIFDNLKLRVSWGQLGNQNGLGMYDHIASYNIKGYYPFKSELGQWAVISKLPSETRTWETVEMNNFAVDMAFLRNRLTVTGEYFIKRNKDMLVNVEVPSVIGVDVPTGNYGELEVKGWEVTVGWQDRIKDFSYSARFNLSDQKDKLVDYGVEYNGFVAGVNQKVQGYSLGSIFGYRTDGYFTSEEEVKNSAAYNKSITGVGDIKYVDKDGDGKISAPNDLEYLGTTTPRYTFGLNLTAAWKGFDLGILFQGVGKRNFYLSSEVMNPYYATWNNFSYKMHNDYWTPENPNAAFPRYYAGANHNYQISDHWLQNAAYVRLKNLQLGYTIDPKLTKSWGIQRLRVYFSGDNLCEYSKLNDNFDPELSNVDGYVYPIMRNFSFGLNVTF